MLRQWHVLFQQDDLNVYLVVAIEEILGFWTSLTLVLLMIVCFH
jgi:hypothetical protein